MRSPAITSLHVLLLMPVFLCILAACSTTQEVLFTQGENELKRLDYVHAYKTFTSYLALEPRSAGGYYNRALALIGLERYQSALDDLDQSAMLEPSSTDALWMSFRLNSMLREAAQNDTTVTSAQRPLQQGLVSILTVYMMGELDKILKVNPEDYWALNERGRMFHDQGKFDAAIADYDAALKLCDTCTWLMYNKALTLRTSWRTREALAVLDQLVALDSLDGGAWLLLGDCRFALGRRREACEAFARSIKLGVAEAEERYATLCNQ